MKHLIMFGIPEGKAITDTSNLLLQPLFNIIDIVDAELSYVVSDIVLFSGDKTGSDGGPESKTYSNIFTSIHCTADICSRCSLRGLAVVSSYG